MVIIVNGYESQVVVNFVVLHDGETPTVEELESALGEHLHSSGAGYEIANTHPASPEWSDLADVEPYTVYCTPDLPRTSKEQNVLRDLRDSD